MRPAQLQGGDAPRQKGYPLLHSHAVHFSASGLHRSQQAGMQAPVPHAGHVARESRSIGGGSYPGGALDAGGGGSGGGSKQ